MKQLETAAMRQFRSEVRRFVAGTLQPKAGRWERTAVFPSSALRECARRGYISVDPWRSNVLAQEMPRCEALGFALSFFVQCNLVAPLLDELGTTAQKKSFLDPLLRGRSSGAMAVTEPGAGSDYAALQCKAERRGQDLVVSGEKTYITHAAVADFLIVAARTSDAPGVEALSLVLVPTATPGVRVEPLPMLGLRTSAPARVRFRAARIPANHLLGAPGEGFGYVQRALNRERLFGGVACVAWAEHAIEKTIAYLRQRQAFGKPLSRMQVVRHQLAEMATEIEAAGRLNDATFERWVAGEDVTREICMIKVFTYPVTQRVMERCLQLHGGLGYTDSHWASRFYRDARALTIAAGTPEVMKDLIAAYMRI